MPNMPSDDTYFSQLLSSIPSDIRSFSAGIGDSTSKTFDSFDKHVNALASEIRSTLSSTSWLSWSAKPTPPPLPPPTAAAAAQNWLSRTGAFFARNKALSAALLAFFGTGGILFYHQHTLSNYRGKRRAKRAPNGARIEVLVIAGPVSSPITKSLCLDLERRGFIVYVVSHSKEDDHEIRELARSDVRPLNLELFEPEALQRALERFAQLLSNAHRAFAGAEAHRLVFAGFVAVPDTVYQAGPVEATSAELYSDALNTRVVATVATTRAFLPIITAHKARVLVLVPFNVASLKPAFHGVESSVVGAIDGFTVALQRELATIGISVTQIRMGSFDCGGVGGRSQLQTPSESVTFLWQSKTKSIYAHNFLSQARVGRSLGFFTENGSSAQGSSLRQLHNAVFDALTARRASKVVRVGRGSVASGLVGCVLPGGLVGWMLGIRPVSLEQEQAAGSRPIDVVDVVDYSDDVDVGQSQSWEKLEASRMGL